MATEQTKNTSYKDAGVDIEAGNALIELIKPLAASTKRTGVGSDLGGFGGVFDLKACQFNDPLMVAATDGVGTKLHIAFDTGLHHTIGTDLVAMCVNDLIVQGAEPLFFLDYFATSKLENNVAVKVIEGIAAGCKESGCSLIGGETAEMPGLYKPSHYDLAGFAVGAVERDEILPRTDMMAEDDVIIGIDSAGLHSNGFSLVRHVIAQKGLKWDDKAPFAPEQNLGEALLTPTRLYVKPLLEVIKRHPVSALAHITGGGLTENLPRVMPQHLSATIDLTSWKRPAVFDWLGEAGGINEAEMLRTFNCGIGMVVVAKPSEADAIVKTLASYNQEARVIGTMVAQKTEQVVYHGA